MDQDTSSTFTAPVTENGKTGNADTDNSAAPGQPNVAPDELCALLALQQLDGLGTGGLNALLATGQMALQLLEAGPAPEALRGLSSTTRRSLAAFLRNPRSSAQWQIGCKTLDWLDAHASMMLCRQDLRFPPLLRELPDCPPWLFLQGDAMALSKPCISIVGTRKPTALGRQLARQLAQDLAAAGFVVCSGMALGIDTDAHRGALQGQGDTIAVWATGLDRPYPASNLQLARRIGQHGAIVTEMPLGTPSSPGLFPRRNRIVSALALGVIVVEAGLPSGSLITANLAAEQNREVFAVPGPVSQPQSKGCHQLIREGAHLVESADDVLAVLGGFRSVALPTENVQAEAVPPQRLPDALRRVLQVIDAEPAGFELLSRRCGLPADELNRVLVDLELSGLIVADAGRYSLALSR